MKVFLFVSSPSPSCPSSLRPTGKHRAVLGQDHRVVATSNHLLGDLAVREGGTAVKVFLFVCIAQAELPVVIVPRRTPCRPLPGSSCGFASPTAWRPCRPGGQAPR